jgi:hypothetical protein
MKDVYANFACNISATWSSKSAHGCFVERDPSIVLPYKFTTRFHGTPNIPFLLVHVDSWENNITNAPLNRRGWVLQERMYAPRVLHFGSDHIFWECTERVAAEITPMLDKESKQFIKSPLKTEEFRSLFWKTPEWSSGNISRSVITSHPLR